MAEFVDVIKQKSRMCDSPKLCMKCPISGENNGRKVTCATFIYKYPQEAEKIIMKWAEEHPIKTNAEKFKEIMTETFAVVFSLPCVGCSGITCKAGQSCDDCEYKNFWEQEYKGNK